MTKSIADHGSRTMMTVSHEQEQSDPKFHTTEQEAVAVGCNGFLFRGMKEP
jgi:hypothetical protein